MKQDQKVKWDLFDYNVPHNQKKKSDAREGWCPLTFDMQSLKLWFPQAYGLDEMELWGYCDPSKN